MSLDIDWSLLSEGHARTIERFLNTKLQEVELPNFLHKLQVRHFELGDVGPEVSIIDICDPLQEFYEQDEEEKADAEAAKVQAAADEAASSLRGISPLLARHLESSIDQDRSIDHAQAHGSGSLRVPRRRSVSSSNGGTFRGHNSAAASLSNSPDMPRVRQSQARRRSSGAASSSHQALRERRSSMNLSSSGSLGLSSSPRQDRQRPRMSPLTQAVHSDPAQSVHGGLSGVVEAMSLDDLETASSASGPPPYDHPTHGIQGGVSAWEGIQVPYFHSAFAEPHTGYVSASGISTPAIHGYDAHDSSPTLSRRNSRLTFGPGVRHYLPGLGGVPERLASFTTESRETQSPAGEGKADMPRSEEDVQFNVKLVYKGNLQLVVSVELALNYPSPFFVTLPLELTLSQLHIEATAVIAYTSSAPTADGQEVVRRVHVCLQESSAVGNDSQGHGRASASSHSREKQSPVRGFHVESKIGDAAANRHEDAADVVRDVEKVEKLMLQVVRELLEKEICFPSYYTFIL